MNSTEKSQFSDIVLWMGRPLFKPYLINHIFGYKSTIQILLIGLVISLFSSLWDNKIFDWSNFLSFIIILCIAGIFQLLVKIIGYRNTKYWITNDAVYIQTGVIKSTVISIQKNTILFINVKKSDAEEKLGAGTIIIDDGEIKKKELEEYKVYKNLIAIKNPEVALRLL
jgi:uncharacterized membrane protein YdbT with pleckstrin-like domain